MKEKPLSNECSSGDSQCGPPGEYLWFRMQNLILSSVTSLLTLEQHCYNQSDLKNKFIIFVKFRLIISVCCLYISVHSSIVSSYFRDYSWLRLGLGVGKWSRLHF